ncbi:MAG: hypothetical protein MJ185_03875 [Treponema sp.]|nr:hypothetical protein [Treponema sp.]
MIKELNYYITTNRFSTIAEDIENSIREYSESFYSNSLGDSDLREKARLLCQEHLVKSGLRSIENSFINIDTEFFIDGELAEENLNRFIKDVLKAHCYQKILWEYMGTTGLMTDISKEKMIEDGFHYVNYLPVQIKEKELEKTKNKITRNFNKLKDESGFNWKKGYDPNDTIKKNGWFGAFDENNVWTYYKTNDVRNINRNRNSKVVYRIKLIKTEKGCMLYDLNGILLNPIILWYLTQNEEVYGGEQSDTVKIVEDIRQQMKVLGVEKITEIACSNQDEKIARNYAEVLGDLVSNEVSLLSSSVADEELVRCKNIERSSIVEKECAGLQKKIDSIVHAKNNVSSAELNKALESGKLLVDLNILDYDDAVLAGLDDADYRLFKDLYKKCEANTSNAEKLKKAVLVLSSNWDSYKSCGISKSDCIQNIYCFIEENKENSFSYETTLNQIINHNGQVEVTGSGIESLDIRGELEALVKNVLPAENQGAGLEYLAQLPEQKVEVRGKVFAALANAIQNYLVIRSSTGMSIKELFDYAIKSNRGALPKSSFEPPVVGYVTPGMQQKSGDGEKRIFIDKQFSEFVSELYEKDSAQKEVLVSELEADYEKIIQKKPVLMIGKKAAFDEGMVYDFGEGDFASPVIYQLLNKMRFDGSEGSAQGGSDAFATREVNVSQFNKIKEMAVKAESTESFVKALKDEFAVQFDFSDRDARSIFAAVHENVIGEVVLAEYAEGFESAANAVVSKNDYVSANVGNIVPAFRQVNVADDSAKNALGGNDFVQLPKGLKMMQGKTSPMGVVEQVSIVESRKNPVAAVVAKADSLEKAVTLSTEEKNEVSVLIKNLSDKEKVQLVHACGDDWNLITPLLVKEYLWRKDNGQSVEGIYSEVSGVQQLASLPQKDLQTLLTSTAVNGDVKSVVFSGGSFASSENLNGAGSSIGGGKVTSTGTSLSDDAVALAGGSSVSGLNTSGISGDVAGNSNAIYSAESTVPVVKLSTAQREYFKQNYGIETSGLSPVMQAYIQSGAWKNNAKSAFSGSGVQTAGGSFNSHTSAFADGFSTGAHTASAGSAAGSQSSSVSGTVKIATATQSAQHVNLNEAYQMSDDLRQSLQNAAAHRSQKTSEMSKMSRLNANYEHDKAVLAKSDPVFAKNQFWDVGHAEGVEETVDESEVKKNTRWFEEQVNTKIQNNLEL